MRGSRTLALPFVLRAVRGITVAALFFDPSYWAALFSERWKHVPINAGEVAGGMNPSCKKKKQIAPRPCFSAPASACQQVDQQRNGGEGDEIPGPAAGAARGGALAPDVLIARLAMALRRAAVSPRRIHRRAALRHAGLMHLLRRRRGTARFLIRAQGRGGGIKIIHLVARQAAVDVMLQLGAGAAGANIGRRRLRRTLAHLIRMIRMIRMILRGRRTGRALLGRLHKVAPFPAAQKPHPNNRNEPVMRWLPRRAPLRHGLDAL